MTHRTADDDPTSPHSPTTLLPTPVTTADTPTAAAGESDMSGTSKAASHFVRPESSGGVSNSTANISKKSSGSASSLSRPTSAEKSSSSTVVDASGEVVRMATAQTSSSNGHNAVLSASTEVKGTPQNVTNTAANSATKAEQGSPATAEEALASKNGSMRYPAASVGLPSPKNYATTLLNLEVKVLTQALGAENQWVEQGDGRVAFCDFTIRVTAAKANSESSLREKKSSGGAKGSSSPTTSPAEAKAAASTTVSDLDEEDEDEVIILEDTINNDTPFVGENCCIVWNSFEKQLSLCLMYATEEGYSASWSALVALQDKTYPAFRYDLLERCRPLSERTVLADGGEPSAPGAMPVSDGTAALAEERRGSNEMLPYSYYIHDHHDPPLGFIEQHALSLSLMEHHHTTNPALYANKDTVMAMLSFANGDLLDHLISDKIFPMLLGGLQCGGNPIEWTVPPQLRDLHVPEDVTAAIAKDKRITYLQESVLPKCCTGETKAELMTKYATLSRRMRNDIVCGLLTCDALFTEASEALRIAPPVMTNTTTSAIVRSRIGSIDSSANVSTGSLSSGPSPTSAPLSNDNLAQAQKAEQQVLAHLRFFRELFTLSISELGREMVGPIVGKVYQCGLFYSLSLVAERFAMPANVTAVFLKRLTDGNGNGLGGARRNPSATVPSSPSGGGGGGAGSNNNNSGKDGAAGAGANFYSVAVEQELAAVLDVTLVRINERQEEQLMNEHVRAPILADPVKYNGIVTFMVRQLIVNNPATGGASSSSAASNRPTTGGMLPMPKRIIRDTMSSSNPFALFHVLGLHDDEGSAASERLLDADNTAVRNQFHSFIITKYLAHATRGTMPPVPLPPALGGVASRSNPIVRFDNAAAAQNGTMRPATHDGVEGSTSTSAIGVPNTGVGVGAGGGSGSSSGASGRSGGTPSPSPVLPLPQGVTPALIRVLEYLVALTSKANRELVLKTVFHPKSHILHFIEGACDTLCCADGTGGRCLVGLDVLCGCVRFLKVVLVQMAVSRAEPEENPLQPYLSLPDPLSAAQTTAICRQLTVERDTFGYLLKAYNKLGGVRRNTVFHSSLLSVLEIIGRCPSKEPEDRSSNNLRDVRDFIFYKHITRLPEVFARRFRDSLLDEVSVRLGRETARSPNDSVSVLSSTAGSELLRSSSKLRFVDEVEAVAGGVDGTVVAGSVMNPAMVANMASAEEKQRKRNARSSLDQWTATATHTITGGSPARAAASLALSDEAATSRPSSSSPPPPMAARASPPLTIHIARPGSSSSSNGSPNSHANLADGDGSAAPASLSTNDAHNAASGASPDSDEGLSRTSSGGSPNGNGVLKPTAPKNEKPPGRPRNFASVLDTSLKGSEAGGGKSRSMPNVTTGSFSPPSSPEDGRLAKSGTVPASVPLARANSSSEAGAQASTAPSSTSADNVVLPKIKKRASASGKK